MVQRARAFADRIASIGNLAVGARELRTRFLEALRGSVGFDAYAWLLTDPHTWVGASPLADVPCLAELPELIRLKYLTDVNRWTALPHTGVASLYDATNGAPQRSLVWRGLLDRYGIGDVASVVFVDQFGCWGFLDLWRSASQPRFDGDDHELLAGVAAPITTALRAAQARTFTSGSVAGERAGPVVLVLSAALEVRAQTPDTLTYLATLVPPTADRPPVPAAAYNVAAQLLALEAGIDDHPPQARVHLEHDRWVTLRAARIGPDADGAERDIAVTIEETSASERVDLFARAFGLSRRERELVDHLVAGADTRELAARMFVSAHTVQDHLKSIFTKTATHSRRELLSLSLGARG